MSFPQYDTEVVVNVILQYISEVVVYAIFTV